MSVLGVISACCVGRCSRVKGSSKGKYTLVGCGDGGGVQESSGACLRVDCYTVKLCVCVKIFIRYIQ